MVILYNDTNHYCKNIKAQNHPKYILEQNSLPEKKIVVLKPQILQGELDKIIEKKKTSLFNSVLHKLKKSDVTVESLKIRYEPYVVLDGNYYVNFYRKAQYVIDVDPEVTEVVVGNGVFPVNKTKGVWKKIGSKIKEEMGMHKKTVDLKFDEHVIIDKKIKKVFNDKNEEIDEPYKITPQMIENYPDNILKQNAENIKKVEFQDKIAKKAFEKLRELIGNDVRIVSENFSVNQFQVIYVPIFEARCVNPDKKVGLLRIDGISKKIL